MKDLIIIAILGICACGYSSAADSPSPENQPWWPTQPPWWQSDWPTWPTRPTTTPKPITCTNYWKYPYPSDCSKFQLCINGTLFTISCPITLHFQDEIQECNFPELAKCEVTTDAPTTTTTEAVSSTTTDDVGVTPVCEDYKKYPYPSDCSKYQQCLRGVLHLVDCPKPLHYHDEIQDCNFPELAKCVVLTTDTPITTEDVVTDPETTTTDRPVVTTPSSTTSTTTRPPNPGGVNCSLGDYHPHPTDCTKYYQCSNGIPYLRPCPVGLHWNAKIDTCDWPNAAGCIVI